MVRTFFSSLLAKLSPIGFLMVLLSACSNDAPPTGKAIIGRDSLPVMTSLGVSKLISDSGVIRYKVVAEEWQVYDKTNPPRQYFPKGIYLERYDQNFNVDLSFTADTAYCYNNNLWKMRGRVWVRNLSDGTEYRSQELYWDMDHHLLYSRCYFKITTPDKDLEGNWFESDESMSRYHVKRTKGFIPMNENSETTQPNSLTEESKTDTTKIETLRPAPIQTRKNENISPN